MAGSYAADIRYVDAEGDFVEDGAGRSAYLVNMNKPEAEEFIERLRARRLVEKPVPVKTRVAKTRRAKR